MDETKKHTAIINDPVGMWSKLAWDADVFSDIQKSYPDERQPLAYAAINVCIAASSLQSWVEAFLKRKSRKSKEPWVADTFRQGILETIPEQPACIAIANTSKHSGFRERPWHNGEVRLSWEEGDEDTPSGYVLYHVISGGHSESIAVSRFDALCRNWLTYLAAHRLTNGQTDMPEWRTNKLNRMFRPYGRIGPGRVTVESLE